MTRTTRLFAAWIACLAILFAAFAPSISHARAAARGAAWMEICSTAGAKLVDMDAGQGPDMQQPATGAGVDTSHLDHCPFCFTHGGAPLALPGAQLTLPTFTAQDSHPFLFYHAPRPLPIWTAAHPRAPPSATC
ncbi:DUF2946 domain-containing protein [Duganella sp. LX20W]|uniref:DUF2946 domain-containing protein n=1 Tax=Rugamonas brunnea TaxID=2758569 RepID=A0A7W2END6_9BURK|nr:DUF2946 domain-containing protein [Rugamonas brunnea]MBA5635479.1 DUF2946 domain-containing protein [Rugamonas brunnea]